MYRTAAPSRLSVPSADLRHETRAPIKSGIPAGQVSDTDTTQRSPQTDLVGVVKRLGLTIVIAP